MRRFRLARRVELNRDEVGGVAERQGPRAFVARGHVDGGARVQREGAAGVLRARLPALHDPFDGPAVFAGRGVLERAEGGAEHGVSLVVATVLRIFDCESDFALGVVFADDGADVGDDWCCG